MRKIFTLRVSLPPKNRLRSNAWQGLNIWFTLLIMTMTLLSGIDNLKAQSGLCDPGVPFFVVDLSTSPNGTWVSPSVVRSDYCCGTGNPNRCVEFQITLHPSAIAVNFNIASGAVPPGALYYQINCGPIVQAGQPVCIYGPGPHTLTFCKPGNNSNTYSITSIPEPSVSPHQVATPSCPAQIWAIGLQPGTIQWQDLTGGGSYLSYLSCTACDSPYVTPTVPFPPFVDYLVCGTPVGSACLSGITNFCDTVRVYFYDDLSSNVNPSPAVICQGSGGIWLNGSFSGGAGPYSLAWFDQPNGTGNQVGNTIDFYATATGTYSFVVNDSLSPVCGNSVYNVQVDIQPLPGVTIQASATEICDQAPVTLTAQSSISGTTWVWNTGEATNQITVIPSSTTTYFVTGTTTDGCSGSAQIQIIVFPLPVIEVLSSSPVICESETVSLPVTSSIAGTTWNWNTGSSDNPLIVSPGTTTIYTVTATSPDGCTSTAELQVNVNPLPVLTMTASSNAICDQSPVTLSAGSDITGTTLIWNTGDIGNVIIDYPNITTTYTVTGTTPDGCTSSIQTEIQVNPLPVITASASSPEICEGETVILTANSDITGTTWIWDSGSDSNPLIVSPLVSTTYSVTGTTPQGCTGLAVIQVIVHPVPYVSAFTDNPEICEGEYSVVQASSSLPNTNWLWNTGHTTQNINVSPAGTTTYQVTGTTQNGCSAEASVSLIVQPNPFVTLTSSSGAICDLDTAILAATSNISSSAFLWNTGASGNQLIVTPSTTTTYNVTGTTSEGCSGSAQIQIIVYPLPVIEVLSPSPVICEGETVSLPVTSSLTGTTWSWNTGSSDNPLIVSPGTTTIYIVTATSPNGCTSTAELQVNVNPLPVLTMTASSNAICDQSPVTLSAGSDITGTTLIWNTGDIGNIIIDYPNITTTYTVTGTTPYGCTSSIQTDIQVNPLPVITASASSPEICEGETVTLTANSNISGTTWIWDSGSDNNPLILSPLVSTTYSVTGTTPQGCTGFADIYVIVHPIPAIGISALATAICDMASATLTGSSDIPGTTWEWNTGQIINPISVSPNAVTTYTLLGTSPAGCQDSAMIQVTVYPLPSLTLSSSSSAICPGESAILTVNSDINGTTWLWNTGSSQSSLTVTPAVSTLYSVTGVSPDGCTASAQMSILVNPLPFLNITASATEICDQASATLYALSNISGTTWLWNTGQQSDSISVSPGTTSLFTVIGTTPEGCTGLAEIQITVHPLPIITASTDIPEICVGESAIAQANSSLPNTNWIWNSGHTTQSIVVSPANNTTYLVTGTTQNGCSAEASVNLIVNQNPVITLTSSSGAICDQDTAIFTATSNISASAFIWNTGETTEQIVVMPNISTLYNVTATSPEGCSGFGMVYLIVNPLPVIQLNQNAFEICEGGFVNILAGSNVPGTSWIWNTGQNSNMIQVSPVTNTTYTVTATTTLGCIAEAEANVIVYPKPLITLNSDYNGICAGNPVTMTAISSISGTTWSWSNGSLQPSITLQPVSSTTYTVTGTTLNGCMNSASINIQVNALPSVSIFPANPNICSGSGTVLTANTQSVSPIYQWCTGNTGNSISVQPQNTTQYSVTVTDINGCSNSAQCTVNIIPLPVIQVTPINPAVCQGSNITLTAHSSNPNTTYYWNNYSSTASITVNPSISTVYAVTGTDAFGCSGSEMILVPVLEVPVVNVTPPVSTICVGDEVLLYAGAHGNDLSFQWSNGQTNNYNNVFPQSTTTYIVTVTAPNGCTASGSAIVNVNGLPVLSVLPMNPEVCFGDDVTLNVSGALNYFWSSNLNHNLPNGSQVSFVADSTLQIYVIGVDANGCRDTVSTDVTVHPLPHADFLSSLCKVCGQSSVSFLSLSYPANDIVSYTWDFGNPSSGMNNFSSNMNPSHYYNIPGAYWVSLEVTTIHGCKAFIMKPDLITVYPNPLAGFSRSPGITDIVDPTVYVFDHSNGATEYLYDFGDPASGQNNYADMPNPVHEYSGPGEYVIWQYVTNEWGCVDSTKQNVIIKPTWQIYIPNAFTPNGDGMNDCFIPVGFNIDSENFAMYIYNRWGEEIYSTKDIEKGWDGSVKGSALKAKQDVYVYLIVIRDIFGIEKHYKGSLTLLK
jgi:gliding motility-associated-like protein